MKNRTYYDTIYQCLVYCRDNTGKKLTLPTTKSMFFRILSGNYDFFNKMFDNGLVGPGLVEVDVDIEHHVDVYKITQKGNDYIHHYEKIQELLGRRKTW